jgi:hypothetical protein
VESILHLADSVVHLTQLEQFDFERLYSALVPRFDLWNHAAGPEHD